MPKFHFDVHDGINLPDARGVDLADFDAARQEAIRFAGELMEDAATRRRLGQDWRMEVKDDEGALVFRLDFTVMRQPG